MTAGKRPAQDEQSGENTAISRRTALIRMSAVAAAASCLPVAAAAAASPGRAGEAQSQGRVKRFRKIATEEAFVIPEVAAAIRDVVRRGGRI